MTGGSMKTTNKTKNALIVISFVLFCIFLFWRLGYTLKLIELTLYAFILGIYIKYFISNKNKKNL